MDSAQLQTVIADAQLAISTISTAAPLIFPGAGVGVAAAAAIAGAALQMIQNANNSGQDITDAQLTAIRTGAAAALADGVVAENAALAAQGVQTTGVTTSAVLGTTGPANS